MKIIASQLPALSPGPVSRPGSQDAEESRSFSVPLQGSHSEPKLSPLNWRSQVRFAATLQGLYPKENVSSLEFNTLYSHCKKQVDIFSQDYKNYILRNGRDGLALGTLGAFMYNLAAVDPSGVTLSLLVAGALVSGLSSAYLTAKANKDVVGMKNNLEKLQVELVKLEAQNALNQKLTDCLERIGSQLKKTGPLENAVISTEGGKGGLILSPGDFQTLMDGFETPIRELQESHHQLFKTLRMVPGFRTALTRSDIRYPSVTIDPFLRDGVNLLFKELASPATPAERLVSLVKVLDRLEWEYDAGVARCKPEYTELFENTPSPKVRAAILGRMNERKHLRPVPDQYKQFIRAAVLSDDAALKNAGLRALQNTPFLSAEVQTELRRVLSSNALEDVQIADLAAKSAAILLELQASSTSASEETGLTLLGEELTRFQQGNPVTVKFSPVQKTSQTAPEIIAWQHLEKLNPISVLNNSNPALFDEMLSREAMETLADHLRRNSYEAEAAKILQNKLCYIFSRETDDRARTFWESVAFTAYKTPLSVLAGIGGLNAVIGMEEEKEEILTQIIEPLREDSPNQSAAVLFVGSPGTGKTFLAHQVAEHLGYPVHTVNYAELFTNENGAAFYGETTARIDALFESAKKMAPVVLLFDELDTLSKKKQGNNSTVAVNDTNQLMANFNKLHRYNLENPDKKVLVMGTANYLDVMEPALFRPERVYFMEINPCNAATKKAILTEELNKQRQVISEPIEQLFGTIAADEADFAPSDLKSMVSRARNYAKSGEMTVDHLEKAYKTVRKQRISVNNNLNPPSQNRS